MPTPTEMFVEQSHSSMPSSVWLHINGVSLTTDLHPYQPPVHSYDYRTKHLQSPVQPPTPPLLPSPQMVPYSITMIDGPFSNNYHNQNANKLPHKLEHTDIPKKQFIDRQIKKAKSLPGLIKGTALSRHTPLQSSTFTNPPPTISSTNHVQDDQLPDVSIDTADDSFSNLPPPPPPKFERPNELRRHRVYFADSNKIQFFEDNNQLAAPLGYIYRRHRRRSSKKTSNTNSMKYISPSIQQPQVLQNLSHPLPRQQLVQELNIKKQQLTVSPRAHSSRTSHLPDILNQSLPSGPSPSEYSSDKYVLQREKPLVRIPKPIADIPMHTTTNHPSENTRHAHNLSLQTPELHNQTFESELSDAINGVSIHNNSITSSTTTHRQRPSLRTISLRQQFISPFKLKTTNISPTTNTDHQQSSNNSVLHTQRSASLRNTALRSNNDTNELHPNKLLLATETRPLTGTGTVKNLKRSSLIHYNPKNPLGGNATYDTNELNRHLGRSHFPDQTQERFHNLLTVVRPPYAPGNGTPPLIPTNSVTPTINPSQTNGTTRSSRCVSARGPSKSHLTSNTILI